MSATSPEQSPIVVDANLAVRAILPMQSGSGVLERFTDWREQGRRLVAPMLWLAEVVSAIRRIAHLGMISAEEGLAAIEDLFALEVEVIALDAPLCRAAFAWAGRLGQSKAYDSFYLALAEQLEAELWTADERLANSARQAGVSWVHGTDG